MTVVSRGACPDPELLTALVDGEVDATSGDLAAHLATCDECTAALAAEHRTKAMLADLVDPVPSVDLTALLAAIPASDGGLTSAPDAPARRRQLPAYLAAAASVVVLMVGAFAFIGATQDGTSRNSPDRTVAIVPAADRLAQEHALTAVQTGLGGAGIAAVPVSFSQPAPSAATR